MNDWQVEKVEELSEEEQKAYLEKLKTIYDEKKTNRKKVWEAIFAAGAIGILSGAFMIGIGGESLNVPGAATIITSTLAELVITFAALWNVSDIEMEAQHQIDAVKSKMSKQKK